MRVAEIKKRVGCHRAGRLLQLSLIFTCVYVSICVWLFYKDPSKIFRLLFDDDDAADRTQFDASTANQRAPRAR